jgi:hypothetical protein
VFSGRNQDQGTMSRVRQITTQAPFLAPAAARRETLRGFLDGDNDGEVLLHGIYDHVLEEPVPEEMMKLLGDDGTG